MDKELVKKIANAARILSADMIEKAASGHPGAALGMADMATVLYAEFLNFDASCPDWPNRDRVVFSNGHASALIYSLFYLLGIGNLGVEDLKQFRQLGSRTPGHPERGVTAGVDFSTGPLGQGLAGAVGLALAERMMNARYPNLINHKTYCFVGDGCLMEGISEEALELAGLWQLKNLIVLWDDNHITIDGKTDIATKTDIKARFKASGWDVLSCEGNDVQSVHEALLKAQKADRPIFIDCQTIIGYGAPSKQNTSKVHGSPLGAEELQALRDHLQWHEEPFNIPDDLLKQTRSLGISRRGQRKNWDKKLGESSKRDEFIRSYNGEFDLSILHSLDDYKEKLIAERPEMATRKTSQACLNILLKQLPVFMGGSADLGGSNLTKTENSVVVMPPSYQGNYINFGVRELAMAGIANGIAAHGGFIPYTSTFFTFSDYMKPAIRLGSLMKLKQLYILTHDSLAAGEDGPTHQPVEQLMTFRAMPNCLVFRPADGIETAECYQVALSMPDISSLIVCSRQNLPTLRQNADKNETIRGAYILSETAKKRQATIIATGSEVYLALEAQKILERKGIAVAVISMPCMELFKQQSKDYQEQVLGCVPRVIVEAGSSWGWEEFLGCYGGSIIAQNTFGASGKGQEVLEEFGFTAERIGIVVESVLKECIK